MNLEQFLLTITGPITVIDYTPRILDGTREDNILIDNVYWTVTSRYDIPDDYVNYVLLHIFTSYCDSCRVYVYNKSAVDKVTIYE